MQNLKVGICQMKVYDDKKKNINKAEKLINKVVDKDAELVILPEMFNCPYDNKYFPEYAEEYPNGETIKWMSSIAKKKNIYLVGGSIPERDRDKKIYNTSFIFNKEGAIIGKHRKMHLFDIDIAEKITFKESDVLTAGEELTVFDTSYGKIGLAICYDIRFPELIRLMVKEGCKIIIIPAAFNLTTGPAHWELLFRSRALDNQVYMIGTAPARNEHASYLSYGNSIITDPWGNVLSRLDEKEDIIVKELDFQILENVRRELPLLKHRREDIYKLDLI